MKLIDPKKFDKEEPIRLLFEIIDFNNDKALSIAFYFRKLRYKYI